MYKELVDSVVSERGFITHFSPEEETAASEAAAAKHDISARVDCRAQEIITIDGEDAYDFDDAVGCRQLEDGAIALLVAIADVSAYVAAGSVLDCAARRRGNSVYLPDRVLPMLPTVLSNRVCSLRPGEERLALCCEMELAADGDIRRYRFFRAVIRSAKRLTYDEAAAAMASKAPSDLETLPLLRALAHTLRRRRRQRGGMLLERPEKHCAVDESGALQVGAKPRNVAHWAIEEAMIAANRCAADYLIQRRRPALHRAHSRPAAEKLQQLRQTLQPLGFSLPAAPAAADFAAVLEAAEARDSALASALTPLVLGTLSRAEYAPSADIGHFGLACERYTHFTSPIRRYPDLLTHRALLAAMAGEESPFAAAALADIGAHCGETEVSADKAGWETRQRLLCVQAQEMLGCEYEGYVSGMAPAGFFVAVDELGIDGMVRFSSLPGYWQCDKQKNEVAVPGQGEVIRIGDKINVQLSAVTPEKGRADFLASDYMHNSPR